MTNDNEFYLSMRVYNMKVNFDCTSNNFKTLSNLTTSRYVKLAYQELFQNAVGSRVAIYSLVRSKYGIWTATLPDASRSCWSSRLRERLLSHSLHSETVVRDSVGATDRVHGIDTTVFVDIEWITSIVRSQMIRSFACVINVLKNRYQFKSKFLFFPPISWKLDNHQWSVAFSFES